MSGLGTKPETNFYVTGGTLQRDAPCYVVRRADTELYEGLTEGKFCYVLTPRQMGKSSLMVRTAAHLHQDGAGVAVLDLTAIGQNLNAEQWYGGLLSQLGRRLDLEDEMLELWAAYTELSPLQRWTQAIRDVVLRRYSARVVIFIDEIDAVRSLPFSTDEFFAGIRRFYNRRAEDAQLRRLTFCLLGVATPSDLIRDTRTTPFNIGQRIELRDFTNTEAAQLAQGLGRAQATGAALLERALYWTGGHPYLTQRLCQAIAEDASANDPDGVDRVCAELFFTRRAQEQDDNLLFVRERMLRSEVDLASLLTLYGRVRGHKKVTDETNPLVSILRLSGIVRTEDGYLKVRNRIYARAFDKQWAKASMPDAELRRQRAAFRRGVLRATAVAAVILAVIASLALVAYRQRNRAEEEARRADRASRQANLNAEEAKSALQETEHQRQNAEDQMAEADRQRQEAVNQRSVADEQRNLAEQQGQANRKLLYVAHVDLAQQAYEITNIARTDELLSSHIPKPGQEDLRGFEWYYLWRLSHRGQVVLRHDGAVYSVAISPDGRTLAAGSEDGAVKLFDFATRQQPVTLKRHGVVYSVAFSPDGKTLATASGGTVNLWDVATRQEIVTLQGDADVVRSVTFSCDGKVLATGSNDGIVRLWDVKKKKVISTLKGHASLVNSVVFSPDCKTLATGSDDHSSKLWDLATGQERARLTKHNDIVNCVAFSPDGKRLATASNDESVRVWDVTTHSTLFSLKAHLGRVQCLIFSPDGKTLATGGTEATLTLWDVATGQEITTLRGHTGTIWSVAFSPDGKNLMTTGSDHTVRLWELGGEQEERAFLGARGRGFKPLTFSPEGEILVTRSEDQNALKLFDIVRLQELGTFKMPTGTVSTSVALSCQGRVLAAGSSDNIVRLWDVATRQEMPSLKGHEASISAIAFSTDGKVLATGSYDGTLKTWSIARGRPLKNFEGYAGIIESVGFSPDGKILATGGTEKTLATGGIEATLTLWDVATGQEITTLRGHTGTIWSVAFSPDGKVLATGSGDRAVKLWDVTTKQEIPAFMGHASSVQSVAFSPDSTRLATGSTDKTVKLWDLATRQPLVTLRGHTSAVTSVIFSADGKTLESISLGGSVKLWHAGTQQEVAAQSK